MLSSTYMCTKFLAERRTHSVVGSPLRPPRDALDAAPISWRREVNLNRRMENGTVTTTLLAIPTCDSFGLTDLSIHPCGWK